MNKLNSENNKQGRSKTWPDMMEAIPTISEEKRCRLENAKTTKYFPDEISAYNLELERDIALVEAAEIT